MDYKNATLSVEQRAVDLLARLTEEEKLLSLSGADMWSWRAIERLGIPALKVTDGPHGVTCGTGDPAMSYPTAVGMASTWNTALIQELGVELGKEMHAKGYHVLLGPAVDIQRAPKFGRNYECYSEDPVLAGKMGAAWIRGVQSQHIGTTPKHLAAYSTSGFMDDVRVSEQALREIYLKPFEIMVKEANPTGMMTSYNKVNGLPTSQHPMQRDVVKAEWGFQGFLISDWRGALDIQCVENGMDIEMPGPGKIATPENLRQELSSGRLDWARIDDAVIRILRAIIRSGLLDERPPAFIAEQNTETQHTLARRIAEESMVLLKNNNQTLPFSPHTCKKLALIGPNAASARLSGGGSAAVSPFYEVSPLDGLRNLLGKSCEIHYTEGCAFKGNLPLVEAQALRNMRAQFYASNDLSGTCLATTAVEQINHAWGWVSPIDGVPKNDWSVQWDGILVAPQDGEFELGLTYQDGGVRLWIDDELVIDDWQKASAGDFEATYKDLSQCKVVAMKGGLEHRLRVAYRKYANRAALRLEWRKPSAEDSISSAAKLAASCDVAVVCVGLSNQFEGGGAKRPDIELPGEQNALIKAVLAANPRTVVVLIGGSALNMEQWIEQAPAVIQAWYPGVEGGNALARILFGVVNPSGKLPNTLPKKYSDTPVAKCEDPVDGRVEYTEGVFLGYRHYDRYAIEPRFAFGYGLSYTSFKMEKVRLISKAQLTLQLSNTGDCAGAETIQIYAKQNIDQQRPLRALKAFTKVFLSPGETREVQIVLPVDIAAYWDSAARRWLEGRIELEVSSLADIQIVAFSTAASITA